MLGLSCQYKRFLFCLGCSSRPSTKYFFPHRTLFYFLWPHRPASWAGQPCWVACLLVCVSGHLSQVFLSQEQTLCILSKQVKWVKVYACCHAVLKILEALTVPFGGRECSLTFFEDFVRLLAGRLMGEDPALLADLGIDFHRTQSCNLASFVC